MRNVTEEKPQIKQKSTLQRGCAERRQGTKTGSSIDIRLIDGAYLLWGGIPPSGT